MAGVDLTSFNWFNPSTNPSAQWDWASKQTSKALPDLASSLSSWNKPTMRPMGQDFGPLPDTPANPFWGGEAIKMGYQPGAASAGANAGGVGGWFKNWMGEDNFKDAFGSIGADGTRTNGYAGVALGGLQSLASLWQGMKQFDLMKQQLAFSKDSFNKNFNAQMTTTNAQLEDRQKARVASNAGAYESVTDYMAKHGIKG